jgi:hypothetical protein
LPVPKVIDKTPLDQPSCAVKPVRLGSAGFEDVHDLDATAGSKVIREKRSMAAPPQFLSAHDRYSLVYGEPLQLPHAPAELLGGCVVCIVAEAWTDQGQVR